MPRRCLLIPVLLLVTAATAALSANAVKPPLRQFKGVPVKENEEDIRMWGEGDSFEDIFESVTVRGSSALPAREGSYYDASRAHDYSLQSAWIEGKNGSGIGEYLEYTLRVTPGQHPSDAAITGLIVFNGYRKSPEIWRKNNRIRRLRVSVSGRPYGVVTLADSYAYQRVKLSDIKLPPHSKTLTLRFTIESIYPGTTYSDTALTELEFVGTGIY
ncbi:MAG: hypothetical protein V4671_31715 [Armatimonadota bacterium]